MRYLPHLQKRGIEVRIINGEPTIGPKEQLNAKIIQVAMQHREELLNEYTDQQRKIKKAAKSLCIKGWFMIQSSILKESIIIVKDEKVIVPEEWSYLAKYSIDEIKLLAGIPSDQLYKIHKMKSMFLGQIVYPSEYPFQHI